MQVLTVGGGRCILHRQHVLVDPGEPSRRKRSYIFSMCLSCGFPLLVSGAQRVSAIFGLFVAIGHLLAYLKQLQLNFRKLERMEDLLARLRWTVIFLSLGAPACFVCTSVAVHTSRNLSGVLTQNDTMLVFWYAVTFNLPICLLMVGCRGELLYPDEKTKVVKHFLTSWDPFPDSAYEVILHGMNQLLKNIVNIFIELILTVGLAPVNLENLSVIITTRWFPFLVLSSGPKLSMAANWRSPAA